MSAKNRTDDDKRGRASQPARSGKGAAKQGPKRKQRARKDDDAATGAPSRAAGFVGKLLPILCAVAGFVAIIMVYRVTFPWIAGDKTSADATTQQAASASSSTQAQAASYSGVSDVWTGGLFTTGSEELDAQVKAYCDALTMEGYGAKANAQQVYNNIVWSDYVERGPDEMLSGDNWDVAAAKHFFSTGKPSEGISGEGDAYEFAAVTSFCLRYFGYSDAFAIPIIRSDNLEHGAVCLVSDENGTARLCDPILGTEGWMLDRSLYNLTVENIGQDLTQVEALGLKTVQQQTTDGQATESQNSTSTGAGASGYNSSAYDSGSEHGYDSYGYDEYGYDTYAYGY